MTKCVLNFSVSLSVQMQEGLILLGIGQRRHLGADALCVGSLVTKSLEMGNKSRTYRSATHLPIWQKNQAQKTTEDTFPKTAFKHPTCCSRLSPTLPLGT